MNHYIHGVARAVAESFELPEPILEVGSFVVAGHEGRALRPLFPGKQYVGVDFRAGPGVDSVENVEELPRADGSVGTVVALNVFEHVRQLWKGFAEVHRVLRPDGVIFASIPFYFHIHSYPHDYWRVTPEGMAELLAPCGWKAVGTQGSPKRPAHVWGVGFGRERPPPTPAQWQAFEGRVRKYAKEPLSLRERVGYPLGRLLLGRRPFEPWLDLNRGELRQVA